MNKFFIIVILLFIENQLAAQSNTDTITIFQDRRGITCDKDTASFKMQIFQLKAKLWERDLLRYPLEDTIYVERFKDQKLKNKVDTSFEYYVDFKKIRIYQNNYLYKYGFINRSDERLMGYEIFDKKDNIIEQKGWDSLGNEIPNYICQTPAKFGNLVYPTWKDYLNKNLDQKLLEKNKAPKKLTQKVEISFVIDTAGFVRNVSIFPNDLRYGIPAEIFRVFYGSPRWTPAIINNRKSYYRQKQELTFLN